MKKFSIAGLLLVNLLSCGPKEDQGDLSQINYAPTSYQIEIPKGWPQIDFPKDNPMTVEGIELGRRLFYDPVLSVDSTISCSSCHHLQGAFTDNVAVSTGVKGRVGRRSSMPLINMAFMNKGLFWDGRALSLEQQAGIPVEDHLEMDENWPMAERKLQRNTRYPELFRKAFGIQNKKEISKDLATKAIAQFERSIISKDSKYDKVLQGVAGYSFSDDEQIGYEMFFNISTSLPDAQCGHCHTGALLTTNQYLNNGIQAANTLSEFVDLGHGTVTGNAFDNGKMRVPTVRNMGFSAPYMHNGSLKTEEDVVNHYNTGGKYSPNLDPLIQQVKLNNIQKKQLLAFLKTLNDSTYINNPAYRSPF
ncbi:MAG: cytochrome-c peroxidase [Saprospiraceae bacterium]